MPATPAIAIIGAGNVGAALGARFTACGVPVTFGVRSGSSADDAVARTGGKATQAPMADAARAADIVFLAVPGKVAATVARELTDALAGRIVVDCNNPLRWEEGPVWEPPAEGSLTAAIAAAAPGARVLKAFNTFGAEFHADPALADTAADVYYAGDDADAKAAFAALATIAGFAPIDCGPLRNAAPLENLAMLWIHLALVGGQGRDVAFKLLRRPG